MSLTIVFIMRGMFVVVSILQSYTRPSGPRSNGKVLLISIHATWYGISFVIPAV